MNHNNIFANLNKEQIEAVQELKQNVLLSAGAGTGKTNVLVHRIINIISTGTAKPEEILCLTFTNKACKEMEDRIALMLPDVANKITIKTIHGFGYKVINDTGKVYSPGIEPYIVYDDADQSEILHKLSVEFKLPYGDKEIFRNLEICKQVRYENNLFSTDFFIDFQQIIALLETEESHDANLQLITSANFYNIFLSYQNILDRSHGLDFKDLIGKPMAIFHNKDNLKLWHDKYKYLMIDEFQDTSLYEYHMLLPLMEGNNVFLSGDLFQTIYCWRGSQPEAILSHYYKYFKPTEIHLRENYRSSKILLEMAFQVLQNLFSKETIHNSYAKDLISKSSIRGHKIPIKGCNRLDEEARWIVSNIKNILPCVESPKDIAILTRNNRTCQDLLVHLNQYAKMEMKNNPSLKFEFTNIESFKFFKRKEIKDVTAIFKYLINPLDNLALKRILINLISGVGRKTLELINSQEFKDLGIGLDDFLDFQKGDKYSTLINYYQTGEIVVFDVESTGTNIFTDYIIQLSAVKIKEGKIIGIFDKYIKSPIPVGSSEKVHKISDEYLKNNGLDPKSVFEEFIKFCGDAVFVGHNIISFDINILRNNMKRVAMEFEPKFTFDTLELARKFYPSMKNHKLEYLSEVFAFNTKSSHNALDDVKANWELLEKILIEKLIPLQLPRQDLITKYLPKFEPALKSIYQVKAKLHDDTPVYTVLQYIIEDFHLKTIYKYNTVDGLAKFASLRHLYLTIKDKILNTGKEGILEFIQFATLSNNFDLILSKHPVIPVITVHQAKGLEFSYEFLTNLSQGTFPSSRCTAKVNYEEEKRLFYVAITRAKKELYLSYINYPSEFIKAIPNNFLEEQ